MPISGFWVQGLGFRVFGVGVKWAEVLNTKRAQVELGQSRTSQSRAWPTQMLPTCKMSRPHLDARSASTTKTTNRQGHIVSSLCCVLVKGERRERGRVQTGGFLAPYKFDLEEEKNSNFVNDHWFSNGF